MIYNITEFEESFNTLLQQDIVIKLNNKILREGKLALFTVKNFYLTFNIYQNKQSTKLAHYELPIPFWYKKTGNQYELSYMVDHFHENDEDIKTYMLLLPKTKLHKLYDKNVIIMPRVET